MNRRATFSLRKALALVVLVGSAHAANAATEQAVPTLFRLLVGRPPSGEPRKGSVTIFSGTVLVPGPATDRFTALIGQLKDAYRLGALDTTQIFSKRLAVGKEQKVFAPPVAPEINVTLQDHDDQNAIYRVRIVEHGKVVAQPLVAIRRGDRGIVGGRDGEAAPYYFLVIEPYAQASQKSSDDITPPKLLSRVEPEYPAEAIAWHADGLVLLECTIGSDGSVQDVRVVQGQPHGLTDAAVKAVSQWRYEPPRDPNGSPIELTIDVTVRFTLAEEDKEQK